MSCCKTREFLNIIICLRDRSHQKGYICSHKWKDISVFSYWPFSLPLNLMRFSIILLPKLKKFSTVSHNLVVRANQLGPSMRDVIYSISRKRKCQGSPASNDVTLRPGTDRGHLNVPLMNGNKTSCSGCSPYIALFAPRILYRLLFSNSRTPRSIWKQ